MSENQSGINAPDPRLDEIQARAEGLTDLCPEYLRQGIRHLQRNCEIYCNEAEENDEHDCRQPDRYDGDRMAAVLADIPFLLAELRKAHEALERVEGLTTQLLNESKGNRSTANELRKGELTYQNREDIRAHEQASVIGHNHANRIRAAVAAAKGDERG